MHQETIDRSLAKGANEIKLPQSILDQWNGASAGKGKRLINTYGATEAAVVQMQHEFLRKETPRNHIGKPISGVQMVLVNLDLPTDVD